MRRRLIAVFVAISTLIAVAFVVPLGFLVRRTAEDRAIDGARADAAAVVPALVAEGTRPQIESAVGATRAGREGRMSVLTSKGWTIGDEVTSSLVDEALDDGSSAIGEVDGGVEVVAAVATGEGELSAIRVCVAREALRRGQWRAWAALAAVGITLIGISVLVADRLSRTIIRPAEDLADAARRLGSGDLGVTVDPDGPPELLALAATFNELGSRVGSMLDRERELVAELSHRLRTPLTKLKLRIDQVEDPVLARELTADIHDVTAVVNELIDEARGALGGSPWCDAGAVVTARAEFWSVLAEDQQRPWRFVRGQGMVPVAVADGELSAALDVLLENVFSHTDEGVALQVGFAAVGDEATIWVEDGGPGIAPGVIDLGTSTSGSTGLGLAIAKRTAEAGGGRMVIDSGALGGASVMLVLPIVEHGLE
ncbi:MAG: HAMP domain-containing protein [Acidimicrobiales bacterium]